MTLTWQIRKLTGLKQRMFIRNSFHLIQIKAKVLTAVAIIAFYKHSDSSDDKRAFPLDKTAKIKKIVALGTLLLNLTMCRCTTLIVQTLRNRRAVVLKKPQGYCSKCSLHCKDWGVKISVILTPYDVKFYFLFGTIGLCDTPIVSILKPPFLQCIYIYPLIL